MEDELRASSSTLIIGDALGDFASSAGRFESELASLSSLMGSLESELETAEEDMQEALNRADRTLASGMKRWLVEPLDTEWPPADVERQPTVPRSR